MKASPLSIAVYVVVFAALRSKAWGPSSVPSHRG